MSSKDKPLWTVTFKNMTNDARVEYQVRASNADNAAGEGWAVLEKKFPHLATPKTDFNVLRITRNG